jgi:RNA polymerase sigma-70 factor (ECF subfamily)
MSTPAREARFQSLVDEHRGILFKVCNAYCRDPEDRRDLAQDMVVQLWRSFDRFDGRCAFSTWMYRIALNVAISHRRSEQVRTHPLVDHGHALDLPDLSDPGPDSGDLAFLHRFIDALPALDKALLLLYLDDRSHQEIAEVLGITPTHVSTKIGRLKQRLRDQAAAPR